MEVYFADESLKLLEIEPDFTGGYSQAVVRAFRKRMQMIRAAPDERDFYQLKSLHFEKLKGNRSHQHSMRLNDQFRLVVELGRGKQGNKKLTIIAIEDYH